jgi:molecular chaperone DnaK
VLGIDFGTSYSSAAALINGEIEWVLDRGDAMIPTVVHLPAKGNLIVGVEAQARLATHPARTVRSIKRILGRRFDDREVRLLDAGVGYRISSGSRGQAILNIAGQEFACEQIAAAVLAYLRDLAEKRFGGRIRKVVIAVPAEAGPRYVTALRKAARLAHLELLQAIPEPIAGALALGMHGVSCERRIAVCDFGGGTFDATLIQQEKLHFSSVACHGDSHLGGDDLDDVIANGIVDAVQRRGGSDMRRDVVRWQDLRMRCESAKRMLSRENDARLCMTDAYIEAGKHRNIDLLLDRNWVEARWRPLMGQLRAVCTRLLETSSWTPADIDEVVLIGGSCLVPLVQKTLAMTFDRNQVVVNDVANLAVACGATLQTAGHLAVSTQLPRLSVTKSMIA